LEDAIAFCDIKKLSQVVVASRNSDGLYYEL